MAWLLGAGAGAGATGAATTAATVAPAAAAATQAIPAIASAAPAIASEAPAAAAALPIPAVAPPVVASATSQPFMQALRGELANVGQSPSLASSPAASRVALGQSNPIDAVGAPQPMWKRLMGSAIEGQAGTNPFSSAPIDWGAAQDRFASLTAARGPMPTAAQNRAQEAPSYPIQYGRSIQMPASYAGGGRLSSPFLGSRFR